MIDLVVSVAIIVIIFSFVLANFRVGRHSSELDIVLSQIVGGITTARNMSLGGKAADGIFPEGGYGIYFDLTESDKYILFQLNHAGGSYQQGDGDILASKTKFFSKVNLIQFCGLAGGEAGGEVCQAGSEWQNLDDYLEIIFNSNNQISSQPENENFDYVGGVIEHEKTGQQAYFYISLNSGLISSGSL